MLKITNLKKSYKDSKLNAEVLRGIDLEVKDGEFLAICGDSGSGKTTLLNMIGAIDFFDSGDIYINEHSYKKMTDRELSSFRGANIGFIFQFFNLIPVLNVYENIVLPLQINRKRGQEKELSELFDDLGLNSLLNQYPNELSGGQQQKVAIARALVNKPQIILADEPTGNLDSHSTSEVMELLKRCVKKYKQTLIMVTHNMKCADMADRVIFLQDGRIM